MRDETYNFSMCRWELECDACGDLIGVVTDEMQARVGGRLEIDVPYTKATHAESCRERPRA